MLPRGKHAVNSILAAEPSSSLLQVPSLSYYSYISPDRFPQQILSLQFISCSLSYPILQYKTLRSLFVYPS